MTRTNLLRFPLFTVVMGFALVLVSCSKEVRLENWLTRDGGKWTIFSGIESLIVYTANDSTVEEGTARNLPGEFEFFEKQRFTYNINSELLGLDFRSSGEWFLNDETFTSYGEAGSYTDVYTKQWVSGMRVSSKNVDVQIRVEWWNHSGRQFTSNFDLELARTD